MADLYLDANNQIVGRLGSTVAKTLLKGNKVFVINAERAVISGSPKPTIELYKTKTVRGDPYNGPFYPKTPDRMIKRVVRGMLPKNNKGREALKKLIVYLSKPEEFESKQFTQLEAAENKLPGKFLTLGEICSELTGKKY
ncbi:MAG: 50S ribosomal protein L13 [Candidatus Aenigmarchaeota archaeon]|nr:50S ribosomal protein L13 [Candidatus Aenigmarchaeota archaeon]